LAGESGGNIHQGDEALVSVVLIGDTSGSMGASVADLRQAVTARRFFFARSSDELKAFYQQIADELRGASDRNAWVLFRDEGDFDDNQQRIPKAIRANVGLDIGNG
jgi:hypothetical protein